MVLEDERWKTVPGLTDSPEHLESLVREVNRRGADEILFDPLNCYPAAMRGLRRVIHKYRPNAVPAFDKAVRRSREWGGRVRSMLDEIQLKTRGHTGRSTQD